MLAVFCARIPLPASSFVVAVVLDRMNLFFAEPAAWSYSRQAVLVGLLLTQQLLPTTYCCSIAGDLFGSLPARHCPNTLCLKHSPTYATDYFKDFLTPQYSPSLLPSP